MFNLRKLVFKPRVDDWAPLAKFYHADEALNRVADELNSTDGRRDPDRCQQLIAKYRQCQDRVLQIIDEIMSEVFPNDVGRAPRDFRAKFPDDILHDSLPGQLWFGAECLVVGSNIVDREFESEVLRPLAKVFVQKLELLRCALKQQSLKNVYTYPQSLRQTLHEFDVVFADFELSYVSAMVPVKSVKEYEMQLDVAVLFSESLMRAVERGYISKCMIDDCDPSIMLTLPRLAIICGLLNQLDGPLRVDKPADQLPEMFRPFRPLLQKIKDLLQTLTPSELETLERTLSSQDTAGPLSEPVPEGLTMANYRKRGKSVKDSCSGRLKKTVVPTLLDASAIANPADSTSTDKKKRSAVSEAASNGGSPSSCSVHNDEKAVQCSEKLERANSSSSSASSIEELSNVMEGEIEEKSRSGSEQELQPLTAMKMEETQVEEGEQIRAAMSHVYRESLRSRFRSSQDLIHRLFVCVAGVADQWQSSYPSDLRAVLKMVLHTTQVPHVQEVCGRPARGDGREEETGIDVGETASNGSSSPTSSNIAAHGAATGVPWIPDNECTWCTGCRVSFTFIRRRHHCRNCGRIFCGRCSRNRAPLPKYGYNKPVRVCNRCFFYKLIPFSPGDSARGAERGE